MGMQLGTGRRREHKASGNEMMKLGTGSYVKGRGQSNLDRTMHQADTAREIRQKEKRRRKQNNHTKTKGRGRRKQNNQDDQKERSRANRPSKRKEQEEETNTKGGGEREGGARRVHP